MVRENVDHPGELRVMMEEVAEKAAHRAAYSMSREVQLEMLRMEQRIQTEISGETKRFLIELLDMKPSDHAVEHRNLHELNEAWRDFQRTIMKKIISVVVAGALLVIAANNGLESITKLKNDNQEIPSPANREGNVK